MFFFCVTSASSASLRFNGQLHRRDAEDAEVTQRRKIDTTKSKTCVDTIDRFSYIKPCSPTTRGQIKNLRKGCLDARLLLIVR